MKPALLICSFAVSIFLWVSGLYEDKGIHMAIFGITVISISGGYFNVCLDTFLARMNPGMASVGTAISMSVKAVSCLIFPMVNGMILGQQATKESIASCCMFMACPCTIGALLLVWFVMLGEPEKKVELDNKNDGLQVALIPGDGKKNGEDLDETKEQGLES